MIDKNMYSEAKYFCTQRDIEIPEEAINAPDINFPIDSTAYISLDYQVTMISSPEDIPKLEILEQEKYIGVDSEWRMTMSPLQKSMPALL